MARMLHATYCTVCEHPSISTRCKLCESLITTKRGKQWSFEIDEHAHDEARHLIGAAGRTSRQRWRNLSQSVSNTTEVRWARLSDATIDPVKSSPATEMEIAEIVRCLHDGVRLNNAQRFQLHSGFQLVNDVHLSFIENHMHLNGRAVLAEVPIISVLQLLSSKKQRLGWDLSQIFIALGSLKTDSIDAVPQARGPRPGFGHRRIQESLDKPAASAMFSWVEWMSEEQLQPPEHAVLDPLSVWTRDVRQRLNTPNRKRFDSYMEQAFSHPPVGLKTLTDYPWIQRWMAFTPFEEVDVHRPWPFQIVGGKLNFVVRTKTNASRKTPLPDDPCVWAFLISLTLSPLRSKPSELLYALQYNWTSFKTEPQQILAPLKRSIQFLREVIDSNSDRIFVHEASMLVVGRLGHFYEVKVGRGAHNAPFIIQVIESLQPRQTTPLCIHEGSFHSTVPLGDTVVSVLLSLLDDVKTSGEIDSLKSHLSRRSPLGFPNTITDQHLRLLHASSLRQFKQVANHEDSPIFWLPKETLERRGDAGRGQQNLMHLFHRNRRLNRRRWHHDTDRTFTGGKCDVLVEHALAADASMPHPQFIELWHASFDGLHPEDGAEMNPYFWRHYDRYNQMVFGRERRQRMPIDNDLPVGDIRNGERRFCEVFPRVWEAMQLSPIGSTLRISGVDGGDLTFEHCHLAITVRTQRERRILRKFATLLGFVGDVEHGNQTVFVRRDHASPSARRQLSLQLERAQQAMGVQNAPPWHWYYREVQQAPACLNEFPKELHHDLRDTNQRRQRHS